MPKIKSLPLKQAMALGELLCGQVRGSDAVFNEAGYVPFSGHEFHLKTHTSADEQPCIELTYSYEKNIMLSIYPDGTIKGTQ